MLELSAVIKYDAAQQVSIVETVGRVLDVCILQPASKLPDDRSPITLFDGRRPCPLKPSAYLRRMLQYTNASPCTFLIAVVYLQRLKDQTGTLRLTPYNYQRFLLTAVMVASKTYDDFYASNKQWALVGDIELKELNALELDLLFSLKFHCTVTREEYDESRTAIEDLFTAHSLQQTEPEPEQVGCEHERSRASLVCESVCTQTSKTARLVGGAPGGPCPVSPEQR
jgi:hypothetical protein